MGVAEGDRYAVSPPNGAACAVRYTWPSVADGIYGGDGSTNSPKFSQVKSTNNINLAAIGTGTITGGNAQNAFKGVACVNLNSPSAGNGYYADCMHPHYHIARPVATLLDDLCCWRLRALLSFNAAAAVPNIDCGISMYFGSLGNNFSLVAGGATGPGVGFYISGPRQLSVLARRIAAGPLTVNDNIPLAATPADLSDWHVYDLTIVSGMTTADPYLQMAIDGVPVSKRYALTDAVGLIPSMDSAANGTRRVIAGIVNNSANAVPALRVARIMVSGARTVSDL